MVKCPICHLSIPKPQQAFLDNCFHLFCFKCIKEWSALQIEKGELRCPLCRRDYRSVFHTCILESFSRCWFLEHDALEDAGFNLTRDHARRRELYFTEEGRPPMITKPVFQSLRRREVQHPEAQCWIRRELEALLLVSDVDMLTNVVIHLAKGETDLIDRVRHGLEPFLHDHAERFAQELSSFLSSGLNIKGYDDFTKSGVRRT